MEDRGDRMVLREYLPLPDEGETPPVSFDEAGTCPACGRPEATIRKLISKAKIYGFGLNFQFCAHVVTFATHSYEQHYQLVRRCYRFGQKNKVQLDVVATEGEIRVLANMRP